MPEGGENLRQRVREQTLQSIRDFYGDSLGRLKDQLRRDRAQLEELAEQLPDEEARALIGDLLDSYARIEEMLEQDDPGGTDAGDRTQKAPEAVGEVAGAALSAAGSIVGSAQETVGQALDETVGYIGQIVENLPGGQLLSRTTKETGETVQRTVDETGSLIELTLDEAGNIVNEKAAGNLADLPVQEEYRDEEGRDVRTVKDESGTLIELRLDEDGGMLDFQVLPDVER